jgi:hypothetical protein
MPFRAWSFTPGLIAVHTSSPIFDRLDIVSFWLLRNVRHLHLYEQTTIESNILLIGRMRFKVLKRYSLPIIQVSKSINKM